MLQHVGQTTRAHRQRYSAPPSKRYNDRQRYNATARPPQRPQTTLQRYSAQRYSALQRAEATNPHSDQTNTQTHRFVHV